MKVFRNVSSFLISLENVLKSSGPGERRFTGAGTFVIFKGYSYHGEPVSMSLGVQRNML